MYQKFNIHTHTYRCGHAIKTEDDYILSAIKSGFSSLGFSEHCAYKGFDDPIERIPFDKLNDYLLDINISKQKYKDKIKIYTGLEFEYFDDLDNYYEELKEKFDFLILGQHLKDRKGGDYAQRCTDKDVRYMAYQVCTEIEKKFTKYIAHIDYFMLSRDTFSNECEIAIRQIIECAKKNNAVIEINLKGIRYGKKHYDGYSSYIYPHSKTIDIINELKPKLVFGYDAHNPIFLTQRQYEQKARNMLKDVEFVENEDIFLFR